MSDHGQYPKRYASLEEARRDAEAMWGWPDVRVVSSYSLTDGPLCDGDEEGWLIKVGRAYVLDDGRVYLPPPS